MPNGHLNQDSLKGNSPDNSFLDPEVERLFAALPELRALAETFWGGPTADAGSFLIYGGVLGRHLDALAQRLEAEGGVEEAVRAYGFLDEVARDGLDDLGRRGDRLLHDLVVEALEGIDSANLGSAYPLMGSATRRILMEMAAWNEFAHEQTSLKPERWIVENIDAFREAYLRATGTLPEPFRPSDSD